MSRRTQRRRQDRRANARDAPIDGPTSAAIGEALHALAEQPPKQMPKLSAIKTLQDAGIDFPVTVGDRRVLRVSLTRGQTGRGAGHLRSDDHVSAYKVEYPAECPEENCFSEVTRYEYSANHHIAGFEKTYCPWCETVHESEEWS